MPPAADHKSANLKGPHIMMSMAETATPSVADFNAGRDLAVEYLHAAHRAEASVTNAMPHYIYHAGILTKAIERLTASPKMIPGFDAALTAFVCVTETSVPDVAFIARLSHGHVYGPDFEQFD
jgi:galactose-1-phosphate uridylyltransferase